MAKQHDTKAVRKLFKKLQEKGFQITQRRSGTYKIAPPDNAITNICYHTHGTQGSLHQLRRDIPKIYGIAI